jgi:hypothetical protein
MPKSLAVAQLPLPYSPRNVTDNSVSAFMDVNVFNRKPQSFGASLGRLAASVDAGRVEEALGAG